MAKKYLRSTTTGGVFGWNRGLAKRANVVEISEAEAEAYFAEEAAVAKIEDREERLKAREDRLGKNFTLYPKAKPVLMEPANYQPENEAPSAPAEEVPETVVVTDMADGEPTEDDVLAALEADD